jgi:DNA (cytosine-5)-methyltransferase 1
MLDPLLLDDDELTDLERRETALTVQQVQCIDHWNSFLSHLPAELQLPSFPMWGDEISATYEYEGKSPYRSLLEAGVPQEEVLGCLSHLPKYARAKDEEFPDWKQRFIAQNRAFFTKVKSSFPSGWEQQLNSFPPSLRKLEWNCKGEERDLWRYVLQFRPSGLRVKRFDAVPALVAMTTTQIPIIGPRRRFLARREGLRLQGLPDQHRLPGTLDRAFAALGNGVHAGLVKLIAEHFFGAEPSLPVAAGHDREEPIAA